MMPVLVEDYGRANARDTTGVIRDGEWNELEEGGELKEGKLSRTGFELDFLMPVALFTTFMLFCVAQVAIGIVEPGAFLQWWCTCNWCKY
jgi:hypothetical protein